MTLQELNQHFELRERLNRAQEMLSSLRAAAYPSAQAITGMPHAPGISDKVGDLASEITDLEKRIVCLTMECEASQTAIAVFASGIEDEYTRMIIRLRFLHALTWKEVAKLIGGRNTENSVKSACYRYLESCEESCSVVTRDDAS